MLRFELEDFFDKFEHRGDLINLASSDALPWNGADLGKDVLAKALAQSLDYPDPKVLIPALESALVPPPGIGVLATSGAAEGIALAIHEIAMSRKDRESVIVVPCPSYGAFRGLASLLGLRTKHYSYRPALGWQPDLEEMLKLAADCDTFIVNNPHNPTGHVLSDEFLIQLSATLEKHGAVLIVDEVFRFPEETKSAIGADGNVVVLGSVSKTHGLPGLRLGWIAAESERVARYRTLQQYLSLTLNCFAVSLGGSVLKELARFDRRALVEANRRLVADWTESLSPLISASKALGGTTICVRFEEDISEDAVFDAGLAAGVLIAPGNRCFETNVAKSWFRLGYGRNTELLKRGLAQLGDVIRDQSRRGS